MIPFIDDNTLAVEDVAALGSDDPGRSDFQTLSAPEDPWLSALHFGSFSWADAGWEDVGIEPPSDGFGWMDDGTLKAKEEGGCGCGGGDCCGSCSSCGSASRGWGSDGGWGFAEPVSTGCSCKCPEKTAFSVLDCDDPACPLECDCDCPQEPEEPEYDMCGNCYVSMVCREVRKIGGHPKKHCSLAVTDCWSGEPTKIEDFEVFFDSFPLSQGSRPAIPPGQVARWLTINRKGTPAYKNLMKLCKDEKTPPCTIEWTMSKICPFQLSSDGETYDFGCVNECYETLVDCIKKYVPGVHDLIAGGPLMGQLFPPVRPPDPIVPGNPYNPAKPTDPWPDEDYHNYGDAGRTSNTWIWDLVSGKYGCKAAWFKDKKGKGPPLSFFTHPGMPIRRDPSWRR